MHKKASHGKISCENIIERERHILNTLSFDIAVPTVLDCFDNYFTLIANKFSDLQTHKEAIKAEALRLMVTSMLNFWFTFEMKPTQLTLVIIKMAIWMVDDKLKINMLSEQLLEEIKQHQEYTKGKMNGIEKWLKESLD